MATKFLSLDEAAQLLGVTADRVGELRLKGDLYGYKDGPGWKFKAEDVERARESVGSTSFADDDDADDVVLLSEFELGESGPSTSSTVIGHTAPRGNVIGDESDLKLQGDSALESRIEIGGPVSDVKLANMETSLKLDRDAKGDDSGLPIDISGDDDEIELGLLDSGLALSDDLVLSADQPGSDLQLGGDDDDVLGGSGVGSDVTHRPSDSGILLIDPSDSGLSLDQSPIEIGAGSDLGLGSGINFESLDDANPMGSDDDFLLTTLDDAAEDESDSGSQVIMLDADGDFDDATATLLASQVPGGDSQGLSYDDSGDFGGGGFGGGMRSPAAAPAMVVVPQEAPFTALSVLGLATCTLLLTFTGMMMYDLIRNMWSWNGPYPLNSSIMDAILGK